MPSAVPESDEVMHDVAANGDAAEGSAEPSIADVEFGEDEMRLKILPGATETAASFEFLKEDHTLGNALRWVIMKNPVVEFCGYSLPHPSEPKMNLRIQTFDGVSVYEVLEKGLNDLMDLCDVVTDKFSSSLTEWKAQNPESAQADDEMEE